MKIYRTVIYVRLPNEDKTHEGDVSGIIEDELNKALKARGWESSLEDIETIFNDEEDGAEPS